MKHIDPEAQLLLPAPPAPSMPPGLVELMEDLSRSVLRNDPEDIFAFCAEHMRKLLVVRDGEETEPKKEKPPLNVKIAKVLAASHKKAEKRRASYDRWLAESHEKAEQEIVDVNKASEQSKGELLVESVGPLIPDIEQASKKNGINNEQVKQDKSEDEPRHDFEQTETVISTVDEQSLNKVDISINETQSVQEQPDNEIDVAINDDVKEITNKPDDEGLVAIDQKITINDTIAIQEQADNKQDIAIKNDEKEINKYHDEEPNTIGKETAILEKKEEIRDQTSKTNEELEEVKRTVSDAIAEIETAAIKTVTNITLNAAKHIQSGSVETEFILQDQEVKQETTDLNESEKSVIETASQAENINDEINTIEKEIVTDLKEQTLNEIKAEAIFVTALEEMTQNINVIKSIAEINKTTDQLDTSQRLTMVLEEAQEGIEAMADKDKTEENDKMLVQEEVHVQKYVSDLDEGEKSTIKSASESENIKDEINIIEKGPKEVVTDLKEQALNEIKAEAIFVTALEEMTHNINAIKSIAEINKTTDQLDTSQRLTMVLEDAQEGIETLADKDETEGNDKMLVQSEVHGQKYVSDLDEGEKSTIESASESENIMDEITIIEKSPKEVVTDLKEQTLNEIKAEAIFVTALEEMTHNINAIKSIAEVNKITDQLDTSQRLTIVLEETQEGIKAIADKNKTGGNDKMLVHVQKHVSDLEVVNVEISDKGKPNELQNVVVTITDTNNEQRSIQDDSRGENDTRKYSNLNTDLKEFIDNCTNKQENDSDKETIASDNVQPIIIEATNNTSSEEIVNNKDNADDNDKNVSVGAMATTKTSENEKEFQEKLSISELVTEIPTQNVTTNEPLNEITITVNENKPNSIDTNGEEEGANNDFVIELSNSDRSPRSLKSNDSGDTDDATNGISAENSAEVDKSIDNSENSANPTMDLETAAVTIQKVFRSFLFKSRTSTIDDETPLDIPYMPDAIQDIDDSENITKVEEEPRIPNKERRNLGLSRMDTVLQTVNEEKSLSLSDDSSTLSSAATVIQAHVRGYLVRNKLSKTASSKSQTQSIDENDQQKNKTVLNIHIVPEGSRFMSRDESLTLSLDLPLDVSPPSLTSYHSLGYDITERRKLLRREDAIQSSISPPSTNSGKSLDVPITNNKDLPEIEDEHLTEDKSESDEVKGSEISGDTTPTVSTTETVIEVIKEIELDSETKESEIKVNSDEIEKPNLTTSQEKDILSEPESAVYSGVLHSGEFHDVVLLPQPTQLSRDDPKHVAREFTTNLVYFLVWN